VASSVTYVAPDLAAGASLLVHLDAAAYAGSGDWIDVRGQSEGSYPLAGTTAPTYVGTGPEFFDFDGTNDFVLLGPVLDENTSFTFEAWVFDRGAGGPSRNVIASASTPLFISGSVLYGGVGGAFLLVSRSSFPSSTTVREWRHVVLTFVDGGGAANGTMVLYIDGVAVSTSTGVTARHPGSQNFRIGAHESAGNPVSFWNGGIAQVRIYDGALSAAEVTANFDATKAAFA